MKTHIQGLLLHPEQRISGCCWVLADQSLGAPAEVGAGGSVGYVESGRQWAAVCDGDVVLVG